MDSSLNQATYDRFKKDILTFMLKPGDTVSAAKIADRYEVSRTPAREALVRLENEGLVDIIPQSKSVISKINLDKARQEWFIRYTLEMGMIEKFFDNVTSKDINLMEKHNNEMLEYAKRPKSHENSYLYQMADNAFHAVTYAVSKEFMASNVIFSNMAHYSRLRFLTDLDDSNQDRTMTGHEGLIALARKKDIDGYRGALDTHLRHILKDIPDMEKLYPKFFES